MKISKKMVSAIEEFIDAVAHYTMDIATDRGVAAPSSALNKMYNARQKFLAAIEEEKKQNLVVVEIRGGCASVIPENSNTWIVDYDNLDSGDCPICGLGLVEIEDYEVCSKQYCEDCKINWDNEPDVFEYFQVKLEEMK